MEFNSAKHSQTDVSTVFPKEAFDALVDLGNVRELYGFVRTHEIRNLPVAHQNVRMPGGPSLPQMPNVLAMRNFEISADGVWLYPELNRVDDILGWHPFSELKYDMRRRPENSPLLRFPFSGSELAAYLAGGVGSLLRDEVIARINEVGSVEAAMDFIFPHSQLSSARAAVAEAWSRWDLAARRLEIDPMKAELEPKERRNLVRALLVDELRPTETVAKNPRSSSDVVEAAVHELNITSPGSRASLVKATEGMCVINWDKWKSFPTVKLWQAVALVMSIDPDRIRLRRMASPGRPVFDPYSFAGVGALKDFNDALRSAEGSAGVSGQPIAIVGSQSAHLAKCSMNVVLGDVARFFNRCKWPPVSEELAGLCEEASAAVDSLGAQEPVHLDEEEDGASGSSWRDLVRPYMLETLRSGQFATAKELDATLRNGAAAEDSPFRNGTGQHRGTLIVKSSGKPLALKTIQNNWSQLRKDAGLA